MRDASGQFLVVPNLDIVNSGDKDFNETNKSFTGWIHSYCEVWYWMAMNKLRNDNLCPSVRLSINIISTRKKKIKVKKEKKIKTRQHGYLKIKIKR